MINLLKELFVPSREVDTLIQRYVDCVRNSYPGSYELLVELRMHRHALAKVLERYRRHRQACGVRGSAELKALQYLFEGLLEYKTHRELLALSEQIGPEPELQMIILRFLMRTSATTLEHMHRFADPTKLDGCHEVKEKAWAYARDIINGKRSSQLVDLACGRAFCGRFYSDVAVVLLERHDWKRDIKTLRQLRKVATRKRSATMELRFEGLLMHEQQRR